MWFGHIGSICILTCECIYICVCIKLCTVSQTLRRLNQVVITYMDSEKGVLVCYIPGDTSESFCLFFLIHSTAPANTTNAITTAITTTRIAITNPAMTGVAMVSVNGITTFSLSSAERIQSL